MRTIVSFSFLVILGNIFAQDNLESLLGSVNSDSLVINTFKSTRIVNNHSVELFSPKKLDLRISHRFGLLNSGFYDLFGLDQAKIRIGLEYGLVNNCMVGIGRSTFNKSYDGYLKYVLLKQSKGIKNQPFSLVYLSSFNLNTLRKSQSDYPFLGRLSYANQLMIASKISRQFSIQVMPTIIHWNMVENNNQQNNIFILGAGFRYLITKSVSINSEYFYRFLHNSSDYYNSFSIGLDIETGGHVFQLHFSNSFSMIDPHFITKTTGDWLNGDIYFGFNISRVFNIK